MTLSREIILVAAGPARYLEMAVDLVLSLREHNSEPVVLVLAENLRPALTPACRAVFTRVEALPPDYGARNLGKLAVAEFVQADCALFLDTDILVPHSLAPLWQGCAPHDFVLQGEHLTTDMPRMHHLHNTTRLIKRFALTTYLKSNSGWFYFRREAGRKLLADAWALSHDRFFHRHAWFYGFVPDEPLLGIVAGRRGAKAWDPPFMPWDLDGVTPADPRYLILHLIGPPSAELEAWWQREVARRRQAAGLPGIEASWRAWQHKIARLHQIRHRARRFAWFTRLLQGRG